MLEKYQITKKEEVFNLLKDKRNFTFMDEGLLKKLIEVMKVVRFREERVLIKQGQENSFCYIIIKGSVSVYVDGKFLYKLRRTGDVFGEVSFVTQNISTATIKADKELGVMVISYSFFNKLQSVDLCLWLARVIGEKLTRTSKIKSSGSIQPPLSASKNEPEEKISESESEPEILPDFNINADESESIQEDTETTETVSLESEEIPSVGDTPEPSDEAPKEENEQSSPQTEDLPEN